MRLMYNIGIALYVLVVRLVAPFNSKAAKMIAGRKEIWQKVEGANLKGCYWIHAPSLGEFEQGRPIIEAIKKQHPESKILLTFFSPSGYDIRKEFPLADVVCYLPFDTAHKAKRFVKAVQPKVALFIKYDIWYHMLNALSLASVPAYLVSAIFRPSQVFFKRYGRWYKKALTLYRHIFVQDNASAALLKKHGVGKVTVAGDSRFDRVYEIVQNAKVIPEVERFKGESRVVVAGSTWPKDEDILLNYIHQSADDLKFIIAPHEVHDAHVNEIIGKLKVPYQKWTSLDKPSLPDAKVLIIDTIGMLSALYRYGELAYIGGGFGVGIHNTLEAATYGIPVVFGPNYQKFKEARDLIQVGASWSVKDAIELKKCVDVLLLQDAAKKSDAGAAAIRYVDKMRGATKIVLDQLNKA